MEVVLKLALVSLVCSLVEGIAGVDWIMLQVLISVFVEAKVLLIVVTSEFQ